MVTTRPPTQMFKLSDPDTFLGRDATGVAGEVSKAITKKKWGLRISNGTDTLNDIDVAIGRTADVVNAVLVELTSPITKQLDAVWAEGTNLGGLDTGVKAIDARYHVHIITNDTTEAVDALFSLSKGAPTIPAGWSLRKRVGSISTDSSGNILGFRQTGNYFHYTTHQLNLHYTAAGLNDVTQNVPLTVPDDILMIARHSFSARIIDSTIQWFSSRPLGDAEHPDAVGGQMMGIMPTVSGQLSTGHQVRADTHLSFEKETLLDNNDTITQHWENLTDVSSASVNFVNVFTMGWEDLEI